MPPIDGANKIGKLLKYANDSQGLAWMDAAMQANSSTSNFADCLTVGDAAKFLGVSAGTLRNWDRSGKLKPRRHPQNGYRIYLREDLEAVLQSANLTPSSSEVLAPPIDWSDTREQRHFVQFYETEQFLIESVTDFVRAAWQQGDCSLIAATAEHRSALERALFARGIDVAEAAAGGRYIGLDAVETLAQFMIGRCPDPRKFDATVGSIVRSVNERGLHVRVFGEMVALLCSDGNREGAIRLEQLWNTLAKTQDFTLYCAYPISEFCRSGHRDEFESICSQHSRVIPAESYAVANTVDERLRAISLLQQKAHSLDCEVERRQEIERVLASRERELTDLVDKAMDLGNAAGPGDATGTPQNATLAKRRILVADDNGDAARTLCMLLRAKGYEVRIAHDGIEAVAVAQEFLPDTILMD
ncbi:MAG TPA: MEDS domain-containing protein, partial [Lacipirellulaceae bacterium]|nr:MEDS domain-containing protein [Lacipirellulaceae bacterium]